MNRKYFYDDFKLKKLSGFHGLKKTISALKGLMRFTVADQPLCIQQ